ncbi:MAG TPA: M15 family metallopeptidase [Candidatus Onthousia faecigallinarum]|mgnify:FL=1|nr:M15 family metallopeptidase [Candidatus Onthousia faecigallinarum]
MEKKKVWIPFIVILFLVMISLTLVPFLHENFHNKKKEENKFEAEEITTPNSQTWEEEMAIKYSYYKDQNTDRYLTFKEKNPTLSDEDIITRVNIGLDQPYYINTKEAPKQNTPYVLVNKYYYLKDTYVPENLEALDTNYSKGGIYLVKEAKDAFISLVDTAKQEGYTIRAISAYRSFDYQKNLYQSYVNQDGVTIADTYSARPGFSDHQTGLVVDVDNRELDFNSFENTKEFLWMQEHAQDFGFILRYPKGKEDITGYTYESWHYRFVGVELAKKIKASNLTFDEYYMRYLDQL